MKITKKTRKSHVWNEDRFVVGKNFFMVIDGATPLIKEGSFNTACWLVDFLKKHLVSYHGDVLSKLKELSKKGYDEIPLSNKSSDYLPTASMSYVEINDNLLKISLLGDCEVVLRKKDHTVERYYTTELNRLDTIALNEMIKYSKEKDIPLVECRPLISDTLIKHRRMINKVDGYRAYTLGINTLIEPTIFEVELNEVSEIYLYSDGFSQSFQNLKVYDSYIELFDKSIDLEEEISKITARAFSDKSCDQYPRFKVIDDITIIKVEID